MPLPFMPAQSSRRARGAPTARFAVRLRVALRFAQQPTGLTLPFGALMVSLPSQISAFCALTARSPCICSRLQVALGLRPKCPGCSIIRASLTVALMVSLPRFGSLCASRKCPPGTRFPSRHRAHASFRRACGSLCRLWRQQPTGLTLPFGALRVALGLRPKYPQGTRFPSRLPGFGADSRSLNRRGGRWPRPPLVSLPTCGSLWPLRAQAPTGRTLPSGAPNPCAAAQKASVASGPKAARNAACRNAPLSSPNPRTSPPNPPNTPPPPIT